MAAALHIGHEAVLVHTICSIFRKRLDWFSFGKEVASPTKIIQIVGLVFNFCRDRVDTGFFLLLNSRITHWLKFILLILLSC